MAGIRWLLIIWKFPPVKRLLIVLPLFFILILWVIIGARACDVLWKITRFVSRTITKLKTWRKNHGKENYRG